MIALVPYYATILSRGSTGLSAHFQRTLIRTYYTSYAVALLILALLGIHLYIRQPFFRR